LIELLDLLLVFDDLVEVFIWVDRLGLSDLSKSLLGRKAPDLSHNSYILGSISAGWYLVSMMKVSISLDVIDCLEIPKIQGKTCRFGFGNIN